MPEQPPSDAVASGASAFPPVGDLVTQPKPRSTLLGRPMEHFGNRPIDVCALCDRPITKPDHGYGGERALGTTAAQDARPGIVPGRLDPYVYAGHFSSLNMARIADSMVRETSTYAIKHDELWALQQAAEKAMRALWTAISDHPIHCHGCDVVTPSQTDRASEPPVSDDPAPTRPDGGSS